MSDFRPEGGRDRLRRARAPRDLAEHGSRRRLATQHAWRLLAIAFTVQAAVSFVELGRAGARALHQGWARAERVPARPRGHRAERRPVWPPRCRPDMSPTAWASGSCWSARASAPTVFALLAAAGPYWAAAGRAAHRGAVQRRHDAGRAASSSWPPSRASDAGCRWASARRRSRSARWRRPSRCPRIASAVKLALGAGRGGHRCRWSRRWRRWGRWTGRPSRPVRQRRTPGAARDRRQPQDPLRRHLGAAVRRRAVRAADLPGALPRGRPGLQPDGGVRRAGRRHRRGLRRAPGLGLAQRPRVRQPAPARA